MTRTDIDLTWTHERHPEWDSTGTVPESWSASIGRYACRIDRFDEGGYAYTVTFDGNPVRNAENESAESWEDAEAAVLGVLATRIPSVPVPWRDLQLVDADGYDVQGDARIAALREYRETGAIQDTFFQPLDLPHEDADDASSYGPESPEQVDWAGFPALNLVGTTEAAEILGWDRRRVAMYHHRGVLPKPVAQLASGPVWRREDIVAYRLTGLLRVSGDTSRLVTRNNHGVYTAHQALDQQIDRNVSPIDLERAVLVKIPGALPQSSGRQGNKLVVHFLLDSERPAGAYAGEPYYERNGEHSGYSIVKAGSGWTINRWSRVAGEPTDDRYEVPYGTLGLGPWDDLAGEYNDTLTNGMALWHAAQEGAGRRTVRGRVVK